MTTGLTAADHAEINQRFYEAQPWTYFEMRLGHLMLVAGDADRYRAVFADPLRLGPLKFEVEHSSGSDAVPTAEQTYAAIEAEVLLHHTAETLLRFVHAHAERSAAPALRMGRIKTAGGFKKIVDRIARADRASRRELCRRVFVNDGHDRELDALGAYIELLARYFLDADSYNAAKHGMAIHGAEAQWTVNIAEHEILNSSGATIEWLTRWPLRDPERPPRWVRATRLLSVEASVALVQITTLLIRSLWLRARHEYLGEELPHVFRPPSPAELFATLGLRHPVIADFFHSFGAAGEDPTLHVQSRHFNVGD